MHVLLGHNAYLKRTQNRDVPVVWDSRTALNPHILVVGGSGSGKTYTLLRMIRSLAESARAPVRLHVFDVHGDLEVPEASTVKFSEATPYGLNPLIVDADPDHGGVRRRIQSFIAALNRTARPLGSRQEAVLRALLADLYAANGFYADRPDSWRLNDGVARKYPKKYPTVQDAARFAGAKLKALYLGTDAKAVAALEQVNGKARALQAKARALGSGGATDDPDLERAKEQAIEAYAAAVRAIGTGRELDDLIRYDSKDVLRSVVDRLDNLHALGLFRPEPPPFAASAPVWRYDIRALASDEKKLFVRFALEAIFRQATTRGIQGQVVEAVVLDEAHLFFDEEPDHILNTYAKEARKFGLGLVCASQSPTHFSEDFLGNVATKILLGLDEMYWDGAVRKLKIEPRILQYIVPKRTLAVQIKTGDGERARFVGVEIPAAAGRAPLAERWAGER
jgi:hypothetical protein